VVDGQVEFWIAEAYLNKIEIERFSQEPDSVRNEGNQIVFVFLAEDTGEPIAFTINMRPQVMGRLVGEVGIVDGPQVRLSHLSYP
jgi:hypothetical protein